MIMSMNANDTPNQVAPLRRTANADRDRQDVIDGLLKEIKILRIEMKHLYSTLEPAQANAGWPQFEKK